MKDLSNCLKNEGIFYLKINPLYYSLRGSHLSGILPEPWAHLRYEDAKFRDMYFAASGRIPKTGQERGWHQYETLNKLTSDQLRCLILDSGLDIVTEKRLYEGNPDPSLVSAYNREALTNKDVIFLLKKTSKEPQSLE